ncbi:MAG: hypothetical protein AB8B55_11670 [Mariniblastus sp.]
MNSKPTNNTSLIIGISLAFAAAMLLAAWLMGDSDQMSTVVMLLVALWWIPFSTLSARRNSVCGPCQRLNKTSGLDSE